MKFEDFHPLNNQIKSGDCLQGGLSISSKEPGKRDRVDRTGVLCVDKTGLEGRDIVEINLSIIEQMLFLGGYLH